MLYLLLRLISLVALRAYFGRIRLKGLENVPSKGAVILVANHPSTLLDPLVLCAWLNRPAYFLANGGLFTSGLVKWLLRQLFMIPVYRQQDSPQAASKNIDSFTACYEMLANRKLLVIFPEGSSENERRLRPVKTGTARIALGALEADPSLKEVHIVCAGINYTNPRHFQSTLMIHYDEPISVVSYMAVYKDNPNGAVRELTNKIGQQISQLIIDIDHADDDQLARDIEEIYSAELSTRLFPDAPQGESVFIVGRFIASAVAAYRQQGSKAFSRFVERIGRLKQLSRHYGLSHAALERYISQSATSPGWREVIFLVAGFPLYLFSELHNLLPYRLPGWLTLRLVSDVVYRAPVNLLLGILTFSLFYGAYAWLAFSFIPYWLAAVYMLSLPLSGYFAYRYYHRLQRFRQYRLLQKLEKNLPAHEFAELKDCYQEVMTTLRQAEANNKPK
jgi:1-acyl-sn-glycerol-3-phosphate acyltransferase